MAKSGSLNTGSYKGRYLQFSWTARDPDVANNKTTIDWTLKGAGTASSSWYMAQNIKVLINGATVYNFPIADGQVKLYEGTVVKTGSYTFTHKDDGSQTFTAYVEAGIYSWAVNCKSSTTTFTLDTIARASQPSCITYPEHTQNVGSFGDTISIHMNRKSSAFTHTVRYAFGDLTGTCINADTGKAATGITTGFKWKIPESFMDLLPASTSGSGTIYVDTYNGSTKVGTKYCGFTATVPSTVKPTCTLALEDTTGIDEIYGSPVQGLSKIKITVTPNLAYSSPIAAYSISADGVKYSKAAATTGLLKAAGSSKVTATVKDKRGRSGSASYTMNVQSYNAPSITALSVHRCDADGTANDRGEYIKVTFSAVVSSMSSKNNATYKVQYKKSAATAYTTVSLSELVNKFSVSNYEYIFAADGSSSYDVTVVATDRHNTGERSTSASTAFTLINYHEAGNAIRFGGVAEAENTFENDLSLRQTGNSYAFQPSAFSGEKGYTLLAVITLTTLNVNAPIVFKLNRRGAVSPMNVYIRFASSSSSTDPGLDSITYEGDNYGAFLVKAAASTWKLYVDNTSGWSNPCVQDWFTTDNQNARLTVEFPSEQIATLPNPYYRATPVISQSILDAFYPVGYILLLYSHADPNDMYPGTTWVRIENRFLWAVASDGTIGLTSGEKEVTLSVNQIPAHSHGSVYSQHATGTKDKAWYTTAGTSVAYGTVSTGGGQAHNNMPPYIQISAWRRTA